MPACLTHTFALFQGEMRLSSFVIEEWVDEVAPWATTPLFLGLIAAGFFGLITGWLIGKSQRKEPEILREESDELEALNWRHEKLVLTERQSLEKQARISYFVKELRESGISKRNALGVSLFELCESIRETRQTVGTDLSRLEMVEKELEKRSAGTPSRPEVISACREMAKQQMVQSRVVRDIFQNISKTVLPIESNALALSEAPRLSRSDLTVRLGKAKELARKLPPNWEMAANDVDGKIRDLLESSGDKEWGALGRILLVDGGVTASFQDSGTRNFPAVLDRAIAILNSVSAKPKTQPVSETPDKLSLNTNSLNPEALKPDNGFLAPLDLNREQMDATRRINPATLPGTPAFESRQEMVSNGNGSDSSNGSSEKPGESANQSAIEQILFRSNDVSLWGRNVYRGRNCRARAFGKLPTWAKWVSLERTDTGERVFTSLSAEPGFDGGSSPSFGFNSSNELFYGARHLGLFSDSCRNEVETKFTYGGWGYGHRVTGTSEAVDSPQALGWCGQEIPLDTVIEIVLYSELPERVEGDLVLDHESKTVESS